MSVIILGGKCFKTIGGIPSRPHDVLFGRFFNIRTIVAGSQNGCIVSSISSGLVAVLLLFN